MISSSYQDIDYQEVVNNIDKCVEHSKRVHKEIIIGSDSNAHSQLWMSESNYDRGDIFEDFLTLNNLLVSNVGNKYTYDCATGKSIIDITIVSMYLFDRIKDWVVHDEDYFSDHKLITFHIEFNKPPPCFSRNFKKANWSYFKHILKNKTWDDPPELWSKMTIEKEAEKLRRDILQALDKVCPLIKHSTKPKPQSWWTTELTNLRGRVRAIKREWKRLSSDSNADQTKVLEKHNTYKSLKSELNRSIKSSKKTSWRTFTSECEDIYMLNKIIHRKQQNAISMMEGCN